MSKYKKQCPYCGEENYFNAIRCAYCYELLDSLSENCDMVYEPAFDEFGNIDVNWKWKRRFEYIDKRVYFGDIYEIREDYKKMSLMGKLEMICKIYFSDFLSTLSVLLFGLFWYLFKGMWQKIIKYCVGFVLYYFVWIIICIFSNSALTDSVCFAPCVAFLLVLTINSPYDYYRYKVLGKKW